MIKVAPDDKPEAERTFLRTLIDTIPDLIWLKDDNGVFLACNARFERFFGAGKAEIIGKTDYDFVDRELADFFREHDRKAMAQDGPSVNEEWITFADDGHRELLETIKTPMRDLLGRLIGVLGIGRNITAAREARERLRESLQEYDDLVTRIPVGVFKFYTETGGGRRFDYVSPRWCEMVGLTPKEAYRDVESAFKRVHHEDLEGLQHTIDVAIASRTPFDWEGRVQTEQGIRWFHIAATPIPHDNGDILWEGIQHDITDRKQAEQQMERIAHYDALTGVPNRVLLSDRLTHAVAQTLRAGTMMAVCFLDLDGFKPVNDTLGHEAGDHLLMEMASRMKEVMRGGDTIARIGGDEFVVLLLGLNRMEECEGALRRIQDTIDRPVTIAGTRIMLTASIGVTLFPSDDVNPDTLLRHADQAMYRAKELGKNRYHLFDPEQDRRLKVHLECRQRLEQAVTQDEFLLYYQPKVVVCTGEVIGAEALIRWPQPDGALWLPGEFLPAAKGTHLETAINEWVIDTALDQLRAWQERGLTLVVSVNIGAGHLLHDDFPQRLQAILERYPKVPPASLELEIMDSSTIADTAQAARMLAACRKLGVRLSLDDFGVSSSCLTTFRDLPVESLKISRNFVSGMLSDPEDLGIVESVSQLAKVFNRSVVAGGVETATQFAMAARMHCHAAQGYAIARPMPADELPGWIDLWREQCKWQEMASIPLPMRAKHLVIRTAIDSHRKWVDDLVLCLGDPEHHPEPTLDTHQCRFGLWYHGTGTIRYGHLTGFTDLNPLHEQIHALSAELMAKIRHGRRQEAMARLPEIYALRDTFVQRLEYLISAQKE